MNNRGMTLVELMVSILLATLITVAVLHLFLFSSTMYQRQQSQSEQLLLIEGIEELLTSELRYATQAHISSVGSASVGLSAFYTLDGTFYHSHSATNIVAGSASGLGQTVEVTFSSDSQADIVTATILVYDDQGNQSSQTIQCRLLNFDLLSTALTIDSASDGSAIYYQ